MCFVLRETIIRLSVHIATIKKKKKQTHARHRIVHIRNRVKIKYQFETRRKHY
jgi:hypothetical protein